jgi:hypothetical protein
VTFSIIDCDNLSVNDECVLHTNLLLLIKYLGPGWNYLSDKFIFEQNYYLDIDSHETLLRENVREWLAHEDQSYLRHRFTRQIMTSVNRYNAVISMLREVDHKYVWASYMKEKARISIHMSRNHAVILKLGFIQAID